VAADRFTVIMREDIPSVPELTSGDVGSESNSNSSVSVLEIEIEFRTVAQPLFPWPSSASKMLDTRFSLSTMEVRPSITMYFAWT
jgi:hypothetical protein